MFSKILIANRGEIACRIIKTARRLGVKTVVVYSDADADSLAVQMADEAVHIGPSPAAQSYLVADKIVAACRQTGAEAVHPGFGFLSEKEAFAQRLLDEKIVFIGPNPPAIAAMGDKIESKRTAAAAGVSTVPGYLGEIADIAEAVRIAEEIGFPVMIKASAGGGGKGIRVAWNQAEVEEGFPLVQNEARNSFGDDRTFIEKFIVNPRHIEIQVLGDKHGNLIHLNERECSIQRRNQKVIEEAPSPLLDPETRAKMGAQALALARAVGYDSAGTVEFVASGVDKSFYFLEMNTRLQVEHPVTELITGIDLVEQMIRVAAGERLALTQADIGINGWAMEARLYAEDPYRNFLPSIGRLRRFSTPREGAHDGFSVRVDTGVRAGDEISMFYDPMIAKLCAHGPTRSASIAGMGRALEETVVDGIGHNVGFIAAVMDEKRFQSGDITTGYIKEQFPGGFVGMPASPTQRALIAAVTAFAEALLSARAEKTSDRLAPPRAKSCRDYVATIERVQVPVKVCLNEAGADLTIDGRNHRLETDWRPGAMLVTGRIDGAPFGLELKRRPLAYYVRHRGFAGEVMMLAARAATLYARLPERAPADTAKQVISPMPGLVVSMEVAVGQDVKAGQTICVIEAMKMQNILRAERDGKVKTLSARAGDSVAADQVLVEFA